MTRSELIKQKMTEKGYTQTSFCDKYHFDPHTVRNWTNGKNEQLKMKRENMKIVSEALDIPIEELEPSVYYIETGKQKKPEKEYDDTLPKYTRPEIHVFCNENKWLERFGTDQEMLEWYYSKKVVSKGELSPLKEVLEWSKNDETEIREELQKHYKPRPPFPFSLFSLPLPSQNEEMFDLDPFWISRVKICAAKKKRLTTMDDNEMYEKIRVLYIAEHYNIFDEVYHCLYSHQFDIRELVASIFKNTNLSTLSKKDINSIFYALPWYVTWVNHYDCAPKDEKYSYKEDYLCPLIGNIVSCKNLINEEQFSYYEKAAVDFGEGLLQKPDSINYSDVKWLYTELWNYVKKDSFIGNKLYNYTMLTKYLRVNFDLSSEDLYKIIDMVGQLWNRRKKTPERRFHDGQI